MGCAAASNTGELVFSASWKNLVFWEKFDNKTWVFKYDPETKCLSLQWKIPNFPGQKKIVLSILNLFFQKSQASILSSSFGAFMASHLFKKPNIWSDLLILHHDDIPSDTALW
jgi:hypothetical protein